VFEQVLSTGEIAVEIALPGSTLRRQQEHCGQQEGYGEQLKHEPDAFRRGAMAPTAEDECVYDWPKTIISHQR
jgi:hypothetical protein